ncbi:FAD/NAD(P)-binding domain-containing protein [Aspergillus sclerotioniger CBS 115572]|uniref:FAD/NAD(P)-binding domain-containing protein n=1 Tax=Aspergillus sclerotioniger CBS 115572 TaxID=1450535 RepID=A0A317X7P1_9EURO|nr:FAD/NAD(P)-binding domain-containing protein [Aspergillus sclerotioniger CBS 115572]PWY94636.1 FAD/NAD(P)-binding domain-containing protein [Aspergillus sclerotioniger CBS 115572]
MKPSPSIAIIGAGPSGLVFARLLEVNGITDYVVFERDESSTPGLWQQGGTLDLHGSSGQLALKRAGLFDRFSKDFARWDASRMHVLDHRGTTITCFGEDDNADRPEIDRLQLRQLLLDSIPAHKIRWGHAFANGTSASGFRLIVGADGAWSKVRRLLTSAQPSYSGKMFIEGRLLHNNPSHKSASEIAGPGSMIALGNRKKLAVQQVADGTYRVYFGLVVSESFHQHCGRSGTADLNGKTEALRDLLLSSEFYATYASQLKELVGNAEGPFRPWPLYRMDPEAVGWARSVAPGVTLLGDAAHVSTPFVGEGVNCSMHDAVVLADCIVKHCKRETDLTISVGAELEEALAAYEEDMFVRGRDLIRRSSDSEATLFADNAAQQFYNFMSTFAAGKDQGE